jgi:predicted enzyme involved in methoxymalonyl-ACP biosynthesis
MGRGVETALLAHIADTAREAGAVGLVGEHLPTPKNDVSRDCYRDQGFERVSESDRGATVWRLDLVSRSITPPAWLTVRTPARAAERRAASTM